MYIQQNSKPRVLASLRPFLIFGRRFSLQLCISLWRRRLMVGPPTHSDRLTHPLLFLHSSSERGWEGGGEEIESVSLGFSPPAQVDYMDENEEYFQRQASHRQSRRRFRKINQKGERQTIIDTVDPYPTGKPPIGRGYHTVSHIPQTLPVRLLLECCSSPCMIDSFSHLFGFWCCVCLCTG